MGYPTDNRRNFVNHPVSLLEEWQNSRSPSCQLMHSQGFRWVRKKLWMLGYNWTTMIVDTIRQEPWNEVQPMQNSDAAGHKERWIWTCLKRHLHIFMTHFRQIFVSRFSMQRIYSASKDFDLPLHDLCVALLLEDDAWSVEWRFPKSCGYPMVTWGSTISRTVLMIGGIKPQNGHSSGWIGDSWNVYYIYTVYII